MKRTSATSIAVEKRLAADYRRLRANDRMFIIAPGLSHPEVCELEYGCLRTGAGSVPCHLTVGIWHEGSPESLMIADEISQWLRAGRHGYRDVTTRSFEGMERPYPWEMQS